VPESPVPEREAVPGSEAVPEPIPARAVDYRDLVESADSMPVLRPSDVRAARRRSASDLVGQVATWFAVVWLPLGLIRLFQHFPPDGPGEVLLWGGGLGLGVALVARLVSLRRRSIHVPLPRLAAFAARNRFVYQPQAHAPSLPGRIFRNRHSTRLSITHSVSHRAGQFQFGNFDVDGRNAVGFLAVKLDAALPHLFLASRPRAGSAASPFAAGLAGEQEVDLEGDFPSTFALYVPQGYGVDVRYLLTPDLMALLVDEAGDYSIEIVDDWFFVYSWYPLNDDARLVRRLFEIMDVVAGRLDRRGVRYRDERAPVTGRIAGRGRRLRKANAGGEIAAVLSVLGLMAGIATFCFP